MIYKTIQNDKYKLEIHYDEDPISPEQYENDCFVVYDHRDFCLRKEGFDPTDIFNHWKQGATIYKKHFILPLYAYIHGGVSLSLSKDHYPFTDPWDTSFKGFMMVKRQIGTWKPLHAYNRAVMKVAQWNEYLSNDCYGFKFFVRDEGGYDWTQKDSCWGYSGNDGLLEIENEHKEYFQEELV